MEEEGWKFKKEVTTGDLVAIALAICAVVTAYFALDKRVAVLEVGAAAISDNLAEIRRSLDRLGDKIDRVIERQVK